VVEGWAGYSVMIVTVAGEGGLLFPCPGGSFFFKFFVVGVINGILGKGGGIVGGGIVGGGGGGGRKSASKVGCSTIGVGAGVGAKETVLAAVVSLSGGAVLGEATLGGWVTGHAGEVALGGLNNVRL